ncbi:hypothetical protein ACWF94_17070 [Streptomyces sp. NPDC055078]
MDDRASGFQSALTFLGAGLSATASVLIALAARKSDSNRAFLVFSAIFIAILAIAWLLMFLARSRGGGSSTGTKYDVFLSSPMASFSSNDQYATHRQQIRRVIQALERDCGFTVYYAGLHLPDQDSFQQPDIGAQRDLAALRNSARFLLVMPMSLVSSCYVEAGYALALGKPSVYYHHSDAQLPFMMRQAAQYTSDFPRCKKYEYQQIEDILRDIETNESSLFD